MKNRLAGLLVAIAAALLSAAPLFAQTAPGEWKQYSYPSDGFALSAPTEPVLAKQDKPTATGTVEIHNYTIELGENSGVMISCASFDDTRGIAPKTNLQNAKNGAISATHATLTSEKEITLGDFIGLQFEAGSDAFHMRVRMYIVKNRLITVMAIAPKDNPLPPGADRVFDSLKLAAPAAK